MFGRKEKVVIEPAEVGSAEEVLGFSQDESNALAAELATLDGGDKVPAVLNISTPEGWAKGWVESELSNPINAVIPESEQDAMFVGAVENTQIAHIDAIDRQVDPVVTRGPIDIRICTSHVKNPG